MVLSIEKMLYVLHFVQTISHSKSIQKVLISSSQLSRIKQYLTRFKLLSSLAVPALIYTALRYKIGLKTSVLISTIPNLMTSILFLFNYLQKNYCKQISTFTIVKLLPSIKLIGLIISFLNIVGFAISLYIGNKFGNQSFSKI